ncbi:tRNA(Phe) (7-(3-amino-3-carboxypropyl)wyosine(37)-O)-methyltransferase [Saliniradius amylolyticus]|uniref:tRNA(Phe) (7-(3-amino-3-carboxypropyl)wyosine(37)-O)-methyltransferase n=1 Tax=Saliniradius amylolyticus TaxID=2183582 RepID=A0A2S2E164_9ALTE|nr:cupin-like domain-containing protein [Saliniradius amylolyticus]AWL11391.1 tRNA(Phe) (7-(3-amino-3-carboxypropyl)wyosine(37)-O)-methyltransferase [Saliniradius amylolyticus]
MKRFAPIQHLDCAETAPDLSAIFERSEPLVLKNLLKHWPVVQKAHEGDTEVAAYLSELATSEPVTVYQGNSPDQTKVFYNDDLTGFNFTPSSAPLAEVLDTLIKDNSEHSAMHYVGSTLIDRWLPRFCQHHTVPSVPDTALRSIWLGNQTEIPAHFDFPDNLACVVAGQRRFTLFPPEQVSNLYVGPLEHTPAGQPISMVDLNQPDLERFPLFREALVHARQAELNPGDAIFIPSMWWHHVASLRKLNILVNYWWRNTPHFLGNPTNALMHALLSIGQLPAHQKQAWQSLFDHWVFNSDEGRMNHLPEDKTGALGNIDEVRARRLRADLINKLNR